MSPPRLPDREEDTWQGGFVLDQVQPIVDVSGSGGMVITGGDALLMLRPGAQVWRQGTPPDDLGPLIAVAAEPRPPWRYAVAQFGGITLFGLPRDQKLTLRATETAVQVTHLAWGTFGKEIVLYVRWDDATVGRVRLDLGTIEHLNVQPMDAIASDALGVVAMVSLRGGADAHALFTTDGVRFEERAAVPLDVDGGGPRPPQTPLVQSSLVRLRRGGFTSRSQGRPSHTRWRERGPGSAAVSTTTSLLARGWAAAGRSRSRASRRTRPCSARAGPGP